MELLTGVVMEIISYGTQPVIFRLVVMSVQFEIVPALEIGIVLKLTEEPQFRLDQQRPPRKKAVKCV